MSFPSAEENGGSLSWAVRDSFLRYVTVIAGGSYEANGVELDAGNRFVFPLVQAARQGEEWHFWFNGAVNFQAHHGFLSVMLDRPEVTMGPAGGVLSVRTESGLLDVASIAPSEPVATGDTVSWESVPTELLPSAVSLFGDVYQAGTELSALTLTATLVRS